MRRQKMKIEEKYKLEKYINSKFDKMIMKNA